jgi:hypothetical protein
VKVVMTLLVRDEADILEHQLRYHLDHGVDFVVATDHRSVDGTTEILRSYEREGVLHLTQESGSLIRQAEWVTRMARSAATDFDATWVLHSDADEFWWPRQGSLREVLAAVPRRLGVVRGLQRHFLPRPEDGAPFYERMLVRPGSPTESLTTPFGPQVKVAHRGDPDVVISAGNHDAFSPGLVLAREWFPLEVLHFPIRSLGQMERKYLSRVGDPDGGHHIDSMIEELHARDATEVYEEYLVPEAELADGLASGRLLLDTRLRDTLRLASHSPSSSPRSPTLSDDAALADEVHVMQAMDSLVRLSSRIARLEERLNAAEGSSRGLARRLLRRGSTGRHR